MIRFFTTFWRRSGGQAIAPYARLKIRFRRMANYEYNHALQDLLDLNLDVGQVEGGSHKSVFISNTGVVSAALEISAAAIQVPSAS